MNITVHLVRDKQDGSTSNQSAYTLPPSNQELVYYEKSTLQEKNDGIIDSEDSSPKNENSFMLSKVERKRRLQFSDKNTIVHTIGRHEISDEEIFATWYSMSEVSILKLEVIEIIDAYRLKNWRINEDIFISGVGHHTCRGLEQFVDYKQDRIRRQVKRALISSIIKEQSRQKKCGISDPILLRSCSEAHSYNGKALARTLGKEDAIRSNSDKSVRGFNDYYSMLNAGVIGGCELTLTHSPLNKNLLHSAWENIMFRFCSGSDFNRATRRDFPVQA